MINATVLKLLRRRARGYSRTARTSVSARREEAHRSARPVCGQGSAGAQVPALRRPIDKAVRSKKASAPCRAVQRALERARTLRFVDSIRFKEIEAANLDRTARRSSSKSRGCLLQNAQAVMGRSSPKARAVRMSDGETKATRIGAAGSTRSALRCGFWTGSRVFAWTMRSLAEKLHALYYDLEDVQLYATRITATDFNRLNRALLDEIETRLELISTLKRKYGASIARNTGITAKRARRKNRISSANAEERREQLTAEYARAIRLVYDERSASS